MSETNPGKTTAIVAYITIVGCLIAITMNMEPKNAFARFHTRQAFGIHILFHALAILLTYSGIVYLALPIYIFYFVLWVFGCMQLVNDKMRTLPVLGEYFQKWFTFIP